ncbi:MAG: alpha/beta hydrolase [Saprospiraceae bacterium]|nr:alpha/beta hydrolase [Saprospiraceae bacterium]
MQSHQIKFPKTARYYTLNLPSSSIKKIFFVFHGYGQLASQFIHKFDKLNKEYLIVAPEGLSRFYWSEAKGIVGASWMTKENRLEEIEDYCNFIQHLYIHYKTKISEHVQINILGFSQGGATAVRWIEKKRPKFNNLILWGSAFPEDLQYIKMKEYLNDKSLHVIYGKQDPYITKERLNDQHLFTERQELNFELTWFEGGHEINREALNNLVENI